MPSPRVPLAKARDCNLREFDTTAIQQRPFYFHSTAIRQRYDHSTTYVTTAGRPAWGLAAQRLAPK